MPEIMKPRKRNDLSNVGSRVTRDMETQAVDSEYVDSMVEQE